jgi:acyl-coenzyme A synthetase/AMP-(fatty) acid ligase
VVLRDGYEPSVELKRALQEHVKIETAPYKYRRQLEFVDSLPKPRAGRSGARSCVETSFSQGA